LCKLYPYHLSKASLYKVMEDPQEHTSLPSSKIVKTWWPLAASWILMSLEPIVLSAVVARLTDPETNLAAWGGVVFPVSLIIEAPIIMLLAASTALSKDYDSYRKLRRFMLSAGITLTVFHFLVSFTPLYDAVIVGLIKPPPEIIEPARMGLRIMLPWTGAIAYRRFNQGALIRFGHAEVVGLGTLIRLLTDIFVFAIGFAVGGIPGTVLAASAVATSVITEAVYTGLRVRPVLRDEIKKAPRVEEPLTLKSFTEFYVPLALTSFLTLLILPLGSAAMSRMPSALESLAVWPVLSGLVFMLRSLGVAYNEVMVALLDEPKSYFALQRFGTVISIFATVFLVLIALTPLSELWFVRISALTPGLAGLAQSALWYALPNPGLNVFTSFFQGILLHSRNTRGITESVVIFLIVTGSILWVGVITQIAEGVYVAWLAFSSGFVAQTIYLWVRSRPERKLLKVRDSATS
jgi:hypothetical protein